jgi:hypothetical protein
MSAGFAYLSIACPRLPPSCPHVTATAGLGNAGRWAPTGLCAA